MRYSKSVWFGVVLAISAASHVRASTGGTPPPALAGANSEGMALLVDPASGRATRLSGVGMGGYGSVQSLALDTRTGKLYGIDATAHELVVIDPVTRTGTPVGGTGFVALGALTFDPTRALLYAVETVGGANDRLVSIDPATGLGTVVGDTGIADVGGLAFDATGNVLYGTDVGTNDRLLRIDRNTGRATPVGPLGFVWVGVLAFDGAVLRGVDLQGDVLVTIDRTTGHGTAMPATLGFSDVRGLAFDPATSTLYGMDAATAQLLRVDRTSGSGTALGPLGVRGVRALAYLPNAGALYATDGNNDTLLDLDPFTGHARVVGNLVDPQGARLYEVFGLANDPFQHRLYGADRMSRRLFRISRVTGQGSNPLALTYAGGQSIFGLRALAFDTRTRTLYGVDCNGIDSRLVRLDPTTGVGTLVNPSGPMPFANVHGMVYASRSAVLVADTETGPASAPTRSLIAIDPASGSWGTMAPLGMGTVFGLAYDPASGALAGTTGSDLYLIDAGGSSAALGSLGVSNVEGLALDANTGTVYGTTVAGGGISTGRLVTIDPGSGAGRALGTLQDAQGGNYTAVAGLAYDAGAQVLYGSDTLRDELVRINRETGRVTRVGALGSSDVEGLAFRANPRTLFGVDAASDLLVRIDTSTGHATAVGPIGFPDVEGLEFDAASGVLYGTDVQQLKLIRIDPNTGQGTAVGSTAYKVDGLAGRIR